MRTYKEWYEAFLNAKDEKTIRKLYEKFWSHTAKTIYAEVVNDGKIFMEVGTNLSYLIARMYEEDESQAGFLENILWFI
jgi:hypothetical protein